MIIYEYISSRQTFHPIDSMRFDCTCPHFITLCFISSTLHRSRFRSLSLDGHYHNVNVSIWEVRFNIQCRDISIKLLVWYYYHQMSASVKVTKVVIFFSTLFACRTAALQPLKISLLLCVFFYFVSMLSSVGDVTSYFGLQSPLGSTSLFVMIVIKNPLVKFTYYQQTAGGAFRILVQDSTGYH